MISFRWTHTNDFMIAVFFLSLKSLYKNEFYNVIMVKILNKLFISEYLLMI
jgi:hypothetical protein